ncbi:NADPH:quinone reductase [Sagittula sp. SSi028]|uniref:NADPH:quinone reductase n=1 Tax=Sagittula sp. SSi028 TaxID=3400636 RepID=UPI003AF532E6
MKAITYDRFGPAAEVLQLSDLPTPTPAAGEVLVRIERSGVNPSDIRARAGGRPGVTAPPFPVIVPHSDGAGTIEAVGQGVDPARVGQRVWLWNGQWQRAFGTAAEYIALPEAQAVPLPDAVSVDQGACLGIPGLTAAHTVLGAGPVAGKTVLVSGGAGSVGRIAVQIAVASGARVLSTANPKDHADILALGAEAVFDYRAEDLGVQILDHTGGHFVDRIVEVEFGRNVQTNTGIIAPGGRITAYGSAQDMTPQLPFYPLMFKAVTIELALIYLLDDRLRDQAIAHLHNLLSRDALDLRVADTLPLSDCAKAHDMIATGTRQGAVLLRV